MVYFSWLEAEPVKRQQNLNALSRLAPSKCSRVHLVVASFQIFPVFSQERENNPIPVSVAPLSSDQEGHISKALRFDGLYRKEEFVGGSGFEFIQG